MAEQNKGRITRRGKRNLEESGETVELLSLESLPPAPKRRKTSPGASNKSRAAATTTKTSWRRPRQGPGPALSSQAVTDASTTDNTSNQPVVSEPAEVTRQDAQSQTSPLPALVDASVQVDLLPPTALPIGNCSVHRTPEIQSQAGVSPGGTACDNEEEIARNAQEAKRRFREYLRARSSFKYLADIY